MASPALTALLGAHAAAGGAWSPSDLSGLIAWWDATVGVTDTSGSVDTWADQSGNGYDLTASSTARPTTGSMTQNSLNVISFDGSNDQMASGAATSTWRFMHEGLATYFFVVNALDRGSGYGGGWVRTRPLSALAEYGAFVGSYDPRNNLSVKNGNGTTWSMNTADSLAAGVHIVVVETDASNQTASWSVDGASLTSMTIFNQNSPSSGQDPASSFTLAGTPFDGYFYGGFAEIIMTNTLVTGTDLTDALSYLNTKWAVY